jgi:hypothetical protein
MSILDPEKLSSHVSGASEMPQGEDLEAVIARLDKKWRELKKLLQAQESSPLEEEPGLQVCLNDLNQAENPGQEDDELSKSWWDSLLLGNKAKFGVTSVETDAIIRRVEKLDEDAKMRERLARVEKHNHALTIYAIACTFLVLFMVFSTYFFQESYASSKNSLDQAVEPAIAATTVVPNPAAANPPAPPQALPQPIPGTPDSQETPTASSALQKPEIPQVEFVGSRTSNKYHYRSCKWTKYIPPKNERVFHSVAEAKEAGYISCPTCRPPLTDEPQTSAR